ncbi:MAG: transcription antitermination factor NusB [Firmicutes bacterium]|nr:transcription antitermination factor NusB [Bacillota bacterium]
MTRRQSRETMMQILFELEVAGELDALHASALAEEMIDNKEKERSKTLLVNITDNMNSIDDEINAHSKSWKTSRMPKVDLAVLRLAVGEARYADDVSDAVVVSEAINLAKKYSTEQSASFVHGVLGAVLKDGRSDE